MKTQMLQLATIKLPVTSTTQLLVSSVCSFPHTALPVGNHSLKRPPQFSVLYCFFVWPVISENTPHLTGHHRPANLQKSLTFSPGLLLAKIERFPCNGGTGPTAIDILHFTVISMHSALIVYHKSHGYCWQWVAVRSQGTGCEAVLSRKSEFTDYSPH